MAQEITPDAIVQLDRSRDDHRRRAPEQRPPVVDGPERADRDARRVRLPGRGLRRRDARGRLQADPRRTSERARFDGHRGETGSRCPPLRNKHRRFVVMKRTTPRRPEWIGLSLFVLVAKAGAAELAAVEFQRQTLYHSPQEPGFTSWVGAWKMPDGDLMVAFTQATGPVEGRPQAPPEVRSKLTWPPPGHPGYDMTGLDLRNVHLRSSDAGKSWHNLDVPGTAYYPRAVQAADGRILVFGH